VLLAAYLHGLNNQVVAYLVAIGLRPFDAAYAFGIGTYGIITLAIVAGLTLCAPIWRGSGSTLVEPPARIVRQPPTPCSASRSCQ
jgi:hypothetical protein